MRDAGRWGRRDWIIYAEAWVLGACMLAAVVMALVN